jgi:hypothetical protein
MNNRTAHAASDCVVRYDTPPRTAAIQRRYEAIWKENDWHWMKQMTDQKKFSRAISVAKEWL